VSSDIANYVPETQLPILFKDGKFRDVKFTDASLWYNHEYSKACHLPVNSKKGLILGKTTSLY
jgi:hypothetical protein